MSRLLEMCLSGTSNWIKKSNQIRSNPPQDVQQNTTKSKTCTTCRRSGRTRQDLGSAKILLLVTFGHHLSWLLLSNQTEAAGANRGLAEVDVYFIRRARLTLDNCIEGYPLRPPLTGLPPAPEKPAPVRRARVSTRRVR